VQFYTKCAVLVLIYAALTAHLCSYNLQQCDATPWTPLGELTALPQTSWLDFGERKRRGKGRGKGSGGKGKEKGTMEREGGGREGNGKEKEKWANGKGRILCSCDFPPRKTRNVTHGNWIDVRLGGLAHAIRHDHRDLTA